VVGTGGEEGAGGGVTRGGGGREMRQLPILVVLLIYRDQGKRLYSHIKGPRVRSTLALKTVNSNIRKLHQQIHRLSVLRTLMLARQTAFILNLHIK